MIKTIALFFITLTTLFVGTVSAEETAVKFATGEWPPYTGAQIAGNGMATEIVKAACTAAGLKADFDFLPWKRAESVVAAGTYLGTFPYKETPERQGVYFFSEPLFSSSFGILMSKKNPKTDTFKYSQIDDLKNSSVGIVTGTDAIKLPLEKIGVRVEEVPASEQNIKKLEAGRIDFYIDDKAVIFQALKNTYTTNQMAEFVFLENGFGEKNDFRIMISQKYPRSKELMGKINAGINTIKESGEHKKILGKYGL